MQDQRIAAEEEPDETPWSEPMAVAAPRARRSDRSAAADEWLRRQVRRLLDQVAALPAPGFLRERASIVRTLRSADAPRALDPTTQAIAAIVFFLLVLCLALTTWQWRAARNATVVAQAQSARTAAMGDFVEQMLRATGAAATNDAAGKARMKAQLDAATPRISQQFARDPRAQGELLGLVATMYRELGEYESGRALLTLQRIQLRRVYGDAHPMVIGSLLDEAQAELSRRDPAAANARLIEADPLITKARMDDGSIRARWWMLRADAQTDDRAGIESLDRAIAVFERQRPADARLADAIRRKAWRVLPTHPAQAETLFQRIASLPSDGDGNAARRLDALSGLARAREDQGEYDAALQALGEANALAERGPVTEARFAWALHREGQRDRARTAFDALLQKQSPDAADVTARAYYAESLSAEGRPKQAIPLLEAASAQPTLEEADRRRMLFALGDAYDRAGLWSKARDTLKAGLDQRVLRGVEVGRARERWGRFLLDRGDFDDARAHFDAVLDEAGDRNVEPAVLAYGGLARVALHREDWDAALTASTHAVVGFENLVGARDVRTGPYLWLIHAEALRRVDDYATARIWATRALDASRRYDAPDAASIKEAEAVMARLLG